MAADTNQNAASPVRLSDRLGAAAGMVTPGYRLCDVGCDHAHIPIALLRAGIIPRALGMDVIPGPLAKARENLELYGEDRVRLRMSDGLDAYRPGEADSLMITGMGGKIIRDILLREPDKTLDFQEMILQPQSDQWLVRKALRSLGARIDKETLILEDGKYYPVIHAVNPGHGREELPAPRPVWGPETIPEAGLEAEDRFGPCLLAGKDPLLHRFLIWQRGIHERILLSIDQSGDSSRHTERRVMIEEIKNLIDTALTIFDERQ